MKVGDPMGGLTQEEHEGLIAALRKEGWHFRRLGVELMNGLVTGIVNIQVVQEKEFDAYKETYFPLEYDGEYEKRYRALTRNMRN